MTDRPHITIDAPDGPTILAARHLDATEGRVQVGTTVDTATRAAITRVLAYVARAHNTPRPAEDDGAHAAQVPAATEATELTSTMETCACCGGGPMLPQTGNRTSDGRALCIPCAKGTCGCARTVRQRWADAILHRGPGYDVPVPRFTAHPVTPDMEAAATARAVQAAAGGERPAAWSAKHCAPDARTDQLQQRIHELESHARDANRLRTDWTAMRDRAEQAEQRAERLANRLDHAQRVAIENATMYSGATRDLGASEQQRAQLGTTLRQVLDAFEAYWARASYCGHGEAAVQPEHFQAWRGTLTPPKEPTP